MHLRLLERLIYFDSIKKKLIFFMTSIGVLSVLSGVISAAMFSVNDTRTSITRKMQTITEIVGAMSEGALVFDDAIVANEIMQSLQKEREIVLACLYKPDNTIIGRYISPSGGAKAPKHCPQTPQEPSVSGHSYAYVFRHQIDDVNGETAGTILVVAHLNTVSDLVEKQVWVTFAIVLAVSLLALGISYILQPIIIGPVMSLVQLTKRISEEKDYSLRAPTTSQNEIGILSASFNKMLATIQERERELYEINEKAESASRSKSEFLANMSHEIRTPINGILGFAQLLSVMELSEKQRSFVEIILSSGNTLLTVINDILDFSKIEAGKLHIESVPFDLQKNLEEVADMMMARAEEKGLELAVRFAPGTPTYVIGDPGRVRQVLMNFVSNAIKFTEKGHVMMNAEARILGNTETIIRFEVIDTGIGIPKAALDKIFEKFMQADASTTKRYGGTGLGLAISQQLAHLMGGEVGVKSDVNVGSTFWFEVPFRLDQTQQQITALPEVDMSVCRMLVVDDHEVNRRILLELASGWRIPTEAAESGEEALHMLKKAKAEGHPFHVAVLDYQLPNMDGEDLSNLIKTDRALADTSLILLTSMGMRGDAGKFHEIGFDAYLVKPARSNVLLDTITTVWLNRQRGQRPSGIITRHSFENLRRERRGAESGTPENRTPSPADAVIKTPEGTTPPVMGGDYTVRQEMVSSPPQQFFSPPSQKGSPLGPSLEERMSDLMREGAKVTPSPTRRAAVFPPAPPAMPAPAEEPSVSAAVPPVQEVATHTVTSPPPANPMLMRPVSVPSAPVSNTEAAWRNKRILLVEDQLTNRLVVESILENMQLMTIHAENGEEAVHKVRGENFDLILMDVQMPVMNGYDATREIRRIEQERQRPHTPIIAVTANAMQGDREKCLEAGMDDYVAKPIDVTELEGLIRHYLGS